MFDDLHDRPIPTECAIRGLDRAIKYGCGNEIRECLQAAVDKAEKDHGLSSPAYTVLSAIMDSI